MSGLLCRHCHRPVEFGLAFCPGCGLDLITGRVFNGIAEVPTQNEPTALEEKVAALQEAVGKQVEWNTATEKRIWIGGKMFRLVE